MLKKATGQISSPAGFSSCREGGLAEVRSIDGRRVESVRALAKCLSRSQRFSKMLAQGLIVVLYRREDGTSETIEGG